MADRLKVVIAPDSFKGTLAADRVAAALAEGWLSVRPTDEVVRLPIADGGEGTLDVFAAAVPGARRRPATVTGPRGQLVDAEWLALPDGTAVVELARGSGLPLMGDRRNARAAHTLGLGQLLAAALDDPGIRRIIVTLGGSASTDGGTGALAALGARFLDATGAMLPPGGGSLVRLAGVDLAGLRTPPPGGVLCLTDVDAPLCGPRGAAAVFGPQKGADKADVPVLDEGLRRLASLLGGDPDVPGAGAAGGTGYGLAAAWGARLVPGAATVAEHAGLPDALAEADLVITGEGRFDATSLTGKVVGGVLSLAAARPGAAGPVPVLLVAGQLGAPAPTEVRTALALANLAGGVAAAVAEPERWLINAATHLAAAATKQVEGQP
ncbi:glycerate kinase [Frankia sp. AgB1.9]|uniref:glycerate kinase n=1 Tax=unclassified Frankia TaxID=2632575 RepID=UPI001931198F|nr:MULTISPECIES: glycerate kinase [unclassified Frankia]MBL7490273.1 glycerate kinase [Frankia sp. AgW1.1]MBL7549873.1 glycerate kinase [Frankia sp. AgB1.9]MBL7623011.1 glycerate kinase [Frankia sp. AgB1.8]